MLHVIGELFASLFEGLCSKFGGRRLDRWILWILVLAVVAFFAYLYVTRGI